MFKSSGMKFHLDKDYVWFVTIANTASYSYNVYHENSYA